MADNIVQGLQHYIWSLQNWHTQQNNKAKQDIFVRDREVARLRQQVHDLRTIALSRISEAKEKEARELRIQVQGLQIQLARRDSEAKAATAKIDRLEKYGKRLLTSLKFYRRQDQSDIVPTKVALKSQIAELRDLNNISMKNVNRSLLNKAEMEADVQYHKGIIDILLKERELRVDDKQEPPNKKRKSSSWMPTLRGENSSDKDGQSFRDSGA
jgi:hypothetical protein